MHALLVLGRWLLQRTHYRLYPWSCFVYDKFIGNEFEQLWLVWKVTYKDVFYNAIHGGKAKNDKIDSHKIAKLILGGNFPLAYVYDKDMRATRDLLRRRTKIVRHGADLKAHVASQ